MSITLDRLKSLYSELDQLVGSGEDVVADIRAEISNLELEYLKSEVFPELVKKMYGRVSALRCEIDFSLQFDGTNKAEYTFCTSGSSIMMRDSVECINSDEDDADEATALDSDESEKDTRKNRQSEREIDTSGLWVEDYSEKAIAVYGTTKAHSQQLKMRGGYFNLKLRGGPGWVFSKKRKAEILAFIEENSRPSSYTESTDQCKEDSISDNHTKMDDPQNSNDDYMSSSVLGKRASYKSLILISIENKELPVIHSWHNNPTDFKAFMRRLIGSHGKPLSSSSINQYCSTICNEYVSSLIKFLFASHSIYDIVERDDLHVLMNYVYNEYKDGTVASYIYSAVKLYCRFANFIQRGKDLTFMESY